jgi:hypothetical protein
MRSSLAASSAAERSARMVSGGSSTARGPLPNALNPAYSLRGRNGAGVSSASG